jgi:hypothetical protein
MGFRRGQASPPYSASAEFCYRLLGRKFGGLLQSAVNLVVGREAPEENPWQRLDRANDIAELSDRNPEAVRPSEACAQAMIGAGVDESWARADHRNVNELLRGDLGPVL